MTTMIDFDKPKEYDNMFIRHLFQVTNKDEIDEIVNLIDVEHINTIDKQRIELFMLKVKDKFGNWFDSLYGLQENFDIDMKNLMRHTHIQEKVKTEIKKKYPNMVDVTEEANNLNDMEWG